MDWTSRLNDDPLPFAKLLGIEIVSAAPDRVVGEMTVREEFCTRPAFCRRALRRRRATSWPI